MAKVYALPSDVIAAVARYRSNPYIPDGYYVGTAKHEAGFEVTNLTWEKTGNPPRYSYGIFQVSDEEAALVGLTGAACADPASGLDNCARVFVYLAERNYDQLMARVSPPAPDVWVYLAMAHNGSVTWAAQAYQNGGWPSMFNAYAADVLNGVAWYGLLAGFDPSLVNWALGRALSPGELLFVSAIGVGAALGVAALVKKYG